MKLYELKALMDSRQKVILYDIITEENVFSGKSVDIPKKFEGRAICSLDLVDSSIGWDYIVINIEMTEAAYANRGLLRGQDNS